MEMEKFIKGTLEKLGINYKWYGLVNNYGYTIASDNYRGSIQHTLNAYGVSCDYWSLLISKHGDAFTTLSVDLEEIKESELINILKKYFK